MAEYKVKFEVFEGPLDLLLYLIKKEEVDIYQVNLTRLAGQFIEYIETMRMLDLEMAGEFLVMAATLMYIKSRELLPVDQQAQAEEEDARGGPALGVDPAIGRVQEIQGRGGAASGARGAAGKRFSPARRRGWNLPRRRPRGPRPRFLTWSAPSMPFSSASASAPNSGRFSKTNGRSAKGSST